MKNRWGCCALRAAVALSFALIAWPAAGWAAGDLVIFSARKEELIKPAVDAFQHETGIKTTILTGKAGELARRIEIERDSPKGDVFIGTTAGVAELLRRKGLLEGHPPPYGKEISSEFRAPDHTWIGITGRVR